MIQWDKLTQALERRGFAVSRFATGREAADYLDGKLDGRTIGMGGSVTLQELGLYERLAAHNTVYWHWSAQGPEARAAARKAKDWKRSDELRDAIKAAGYILEDSREGQKVRKAL